MGDRHDPEDNTLYGSDHYPLVAEFEFTLFPKGHVLYWKRGIINEAKTNWKSNKPKAANFNRILVAKSKFIMGFPEFADLSSEINLNVSLA